MCSANDDFAQGYDRLYEIAITPLELQEIQRAGHIAHANVVAAMLSPNTPAAILRHYLVVARDTLEADTRAMYNDIVGAHEADSSMPLGITRRFHDEQERAYNSTLGEATRSSPATEQSSAYTVSSANLSDEERSALREIERVQAYIDLFDQLADLVVDTTGYRCRKF